MRRLLTAALLCCALAVSACGGSDEEEAAAPAETPAATEAATPPGVDAIAAAIGNDLSSKPEFPAPEGDPPTELVVEDIVEGTGRPARPGDQVTVQYVGASWSTGEEFDASWDTGQALTFPLGQQAVISGWDEGVAGMRPGGRRLLVIPPDLGYGAQGAGNGAIAPNETLVFVVDLVRVGA